MLRGEQDVADAVIVREKLLSDFRDAHGPFDVIGDVHGCREELEALLTELGYTVTFRWEESSHFAPTRPHLCPIDFLHAHRPHSLAMLDRARRVEVGELGLRIPVVEVEDLIGLKVQAFVNDPDRRRGELVDIRALLEATAARGAKLDLDRVREYFALFGEQHELDGLMVGLEHAFE